MEEIKNRIKELGLIPIDLSKHKRLLVVDCSYITDDYDDMSNAELKKSLMEEYDCDVLLIDSSKHNSCSNGRSLPVYFA